MGRLYVDTKEMDGQIDGLPEKIEDLKKNFQEIDKIYREMLEGMSEKKRSVCEGKWKEQRARAEEMLGHLEYLNRMEDFARERYQFTEEHVFALVQELPE